MDPYCRLANAIIIQAVHDYRKALRHNSLQAQGVNCQQNIAELERFFTSDWFRLLSDLDGKALMARVRKLEEMGVRV